MIDTKSLPELSAFAAYFEEISRIPRISGMTSPIADYLVNFAKGRGLEYCRDEFDNVIIKKPAVAGYEDRPTVILQGHADMVPAGTPEKIEQLKSVGVKIVQEGDIIRADGTTLGADNGIAVAYMLAVLESSSISHPALECLFTSNEEIGLLGAGAIDGALLKGRVMINMDAGGDGCFIAGCAGGLKADISLPILRESVFGKRYKITLSGFLGGHSGVDIHMNRVNAIKVLCEILDGLSDTRLVSFEGGSADNAIPAGAEAVFIYDKDISSLCEITAPIFAKYKAIEPCAEMSVDEVSDEARALDADSTERIISLILREPTGVVSMSADMPELVETSLNIGTAQLLDNSFELVISIRSPLEESKLKVLSEVEKIAKAHNGSVGTSGEYPGWAYRKVSHLRDICTKCHEELFGTSPAVVTIHAGLECGLFSSKLDGLDCISMGPTTYDVHTVNEHFSLLSAERFWKLLIKVLDKI